MKQYLDLLKDVLENGQKEENRTGIDTLTLPGAMLKFDLREGFPAVTTKKLAIKAVVGELIGFLRGCTSAADYRELGCKVWDQNANENQAWLANPHRNGTDDLGKLGYAHGWRNFGGERTFPGSGVDQIRNALEEVRHNPSSRRILTSTWHPGELSKAALPPCHVMFQLLPRSDGTLHMTMYMRSVDLFLGLPFNIASYAILLHLFAAWSGRQAATLTMFLADAHIYENHIDQVEEQLTREPFPLPQLEFSTPPNAEQASLDALLDFLHPDQINLLDYQCHPAIKAPMAV